MDWFLGGLRTLSQLLTAGIAITAFSLLLYALTFNLRDRVARSFAAILVCVAVIYSSEAVASVLEGSINVSPWMFWLHFEWIGNIFLPVTYLHFSDALLETTGRPSRGRRRWMVRVGYAVGIIFFVLLVSGRLVAIPTDAVQELVDPLRLKPLPATWLFGIFYMINMGWALINFWRAF